MHSEPSYGNQFGCEFETKNGYDCVLEAVYGQQRTILVSVSLDCQLLIVVSNPLFCSSFVRVTAQQHNRKRENSYKCESTGASIKIICVDVTTALTNFTIGVF